MNYELAKELKDAGYDQTVHGGHIADGPHHPPLEELIEACGEDFGSVSRHPENWYAFNYKADLSQWGFDPTEAVARLWIALHAKK